MRRQGKLGWFLHDITHRGVTAWLLAGLLIGFYVALYFTDSLEPVSASIFGLAGGNKWFLYGALYTLAIWGGGVFMLWKYRHNRYQVVRTSVVMLVQTLFGFSIPYLMERDGVHGYYFSYIWPLKFDYMQPYHFANYAAPFVAWSVFAAFVLTPVLSILFGKRWYCSWVCGCGGLANTFGEPWRHLSSKSTWAWRFERVSIHFVLGLAIVTTVVTLISSIVPDLKPFVFKAGARAFVDWSYWGLSGLTLAVGAMLLARPQRRARTAAGIGVSLLLLWILHWTLREPAVGALRQIPTLSETSGWLNGWYGFVVASLLSGVVGVGLYPLGGTRVWCRNFCPMAALLGLTQKLGRYRIRVKKDMCISCGMCSKYCEMGIDVRAYAQANQSFTRASCVGCGMCAEVCPRGVLHLENSTRREPQDLLQIRDLPEDWKGPHLSVGARV